MSTDADLWRHTGMRRASALRSTLMVAKRQREDMTQRHACATDINRMARGFIARRTRRARRVELTLGPRVRELCEKFIAKGDLFQFLEAVNHDYELHMAQQAELRMLEVENATTFIRASVCSPRVALETERIPVIVSKASNCSFATRMTATH